MSKLGKFAAACAAMVCAFGVCDTFGVTLEVGAGENGSATGGGEYEAGATATLTATPVEGKRFCRWSGDIDGIADILSPNTTLTMGETAASVTALFGDEIVVSHEDGDYDNLNDAVANATDYATIVVKDGVYTNSTRAHLSVAKPVVIVSENGRGRTFFRSSKDVVNGKVYDPQNPFCGLKLDNDLAVVRELTFFNYGCDSAPSSAPFGLALYVVKGLVESCTISNSLPNHGGAAFQLAGGKARNLYLTGNGGGDGGFEGFAAYVTGGTLSDSVISDNSGLHALRVDGATASAVRCVVCNGGAGLYLKNGLAEDCIITNNTGTASGVYQSGGTLRRCLVAYNKTGSTQKYGGVNSEGGAIENCDIYGNSSKYPVGIQLRKTAGSVSDTVVADGIVSIPSSDLVSVAEGVTVANCTFQCPSVGGSAELNASAYFTSNDVCWIEADWVVGISPLTVSFTAHCSDATSWSWDFGDGDGAQTAAPQHTFNVVGDYTVTLTCGERMATLPVRVYPLKTYARKNGGNVFPYDTEEKAATSIQAAIDAVYADDAIRGEVSLGDETWTYSGTDTAKNLGAWIWLNRGVRLIGPESGEAKLDAGRKIQTLYMYHPRGILERVTVSNGSYSPYSGTMCGGSLYMLDGLITNCVISKGFSLMAGNATVYGGQVWDSTFCDGVSSTAGPDRYDGGVGVWGKALVANCLVSGSSGGRGGGVSLHHADAVVSNCVIRGSTSAPYGGAGAAIDAGLLTHCVITNNTGAYGGGVYLYGDKAKVRNCLIAKNTTSGAGGGVQIDKGLIENCTVAYNTSASATRSDELRRVGGTVRNCIFCGKDTPAMKDVSGTGGTITYSCFRADVGVTGTGVLCQDPKLKSPTADDFMPMFGSPAVDNGMEIADVATDLRGLPRPVNDIWDMGCYEMDFSGQLSASFDADKTEGGGVTEVTLTANVNGGTAPYAYAWTIGGKTVTTDEPVYTVTLGYGSHTITLVVTDKDGNSADPVMREDLVKIKAPVVYVSTTGSSVWPYDTWEKATADWTEAVGAVYATESVPGRIWVADGTYTAHDSSPCTVPLSEPVELCGTNPACKAIFNGQSKYHRVVNVAHDLALVANLRFDSCKGQYGTYSDSAEPQAGAIALTAGIVSNCVFSGGSGSGAGLVYQKAGLLTDCVIRDYNSGTHTGSDREGGGLHLAGGTAERLVVSGCTDGSAGAVYVVGTSAVLRDSVIRNNYTEAGGAIGLVKGLVENCIITNNTSGSGSEGFGVTAGTGGAGVYQKGGTLRNCLIADNRSSGSGDLRGALYLTGALTKAYNNTVWVNTMKGGVTNDVAVASGTLANTLACTVTNVAGTVSHCFVAATDGDPKFKSPKKAAFHLKSSSPCVNAGDNSFWNGIADPVDLDGTPRIRNGIVDIGCFEGDQSGLRLIVR